jgi:hypothetical protein
MIRDTLADARAELAALHRRETELEQQIALAEAVLGDAPAGGGRNDTLTLHEALAQVLRERQNEGLTARELADAVNSRELYRTRDGSPVEANQVQARVNNYGTVFEKDGPVIRLREECDVLRNTPPAVTPFRDDDRGFFDWLDQHPDGYFVNTERNPKPNYLVLHKPECPHFSRNEQVHWTKDYVKFCSTNRGRLEEWALNQVGGEVTLCRSCFG